MVGKMPLEERFSAWERWGALATGRIGQSDCRNSIDRGHAWTLSMAGRNAALTVEMNQAGFPR
jgi:hypothetical protein